MNPLWTQVIIHTTLRHKKRKEEGEMSYSGYQLAKGHRELVITLKRFLKDVLFISAGIVSASFGFKGFLLTNRFIDGGATGISLLITALTGIPLQYLIVAVNIPFIIMAYTAVSKRFAVRAALAITGLSICLATVSFPNVTNDNLLVAAFGGFFLGAGIGLAVRGGAVIDGTEVLAIFLSRKFGTTIGDVVMAINALIFGAAAYLLSVETALYSMITYLAASKTLDFVVEGIEEYIGVTIVSSHRDEICDMIVRNLGRGLTVYNGKRGMGRHGYMEERDIVFTVITRLEVGKLNSEIEKIDPNAFVVMHRVKDTHGGMINRSYTPID